MTAPNIVGITTLTGKTTNLLLADTAANTLLSNAASSNTALKINTIMIANVDGTSAADITIALHPAAAGGGTGVKIANTISVAADSTLILIDKSSSFYLEEDRSIVGTASAANDLAVTISYEEIL